MIDALIAGAGPAGTIAGRALAARGARVLLIDRAAFPRDKLCGDTLNPGLMRLLDNLGLGAPIRSRGLALSGMRVTGPGADVAAVYPPGAAGVSIRRLDLDALLLDEAVKAGVRFEPGFVVRDVLREEAGGQSLVRGLVLTDPAGATVRMPAAVTIAADGRRSTIAHALGLSRVPPRPRRWAYGMYVARRNNPGDALIGEMHVRHGWYAGVAPVPGDLCNVCVVIDQPHAAGDPLALMRRVLERDSELRDRFASATPASGVSALGPLAIDVRSAGVAGAFLAGDAAGFVDPMTGDGMHLAIRGALLAADEAGRVLETGDWTGAVERLNLMRRQVLGSKVQFNRRLRALTTSRAGVSAAGLAGRVAPGLLRSMIVRAGDAA